MAKFHSVINVRPDKMVELCFYCDDSKAALEHYEANGYEVTHEICSKCIERYKMDSLKPRRIKPFVSTVRYAN